MKRQVVLDLTGVGQIPEWFGDANRIIPVRGGLHYRDIDIIERLVPAEDVARWRQHAHQKLEKKHGTAYDQDAREESEEMPIGFDLESLPVGAIIRVEEVPA